jgi:hypothetical protein
MSQIKRNKSMPKTASAEHIALSDQWKNLFKLPPPRQCSAVFLKQAVEWKQQVNEHGGLSTEYLRMLKSGKAISTLTPGTKLIREWHKTSYQVTVTDNGFDLNGKAYRSLSAIAKEITGTNWNGKVFFGVKS